MDYNLLAVLIYLFMGILIFMHVPLGIAMCIAGFTGVFFILGFGPALSMFSTLPIETLTNPNLVAIPLFLLMGSFAAAAGLSTDLYRLFNALLGHVRGGLAMATVVGSAGFGAICGSSIATASTFMRVALPEMLARKYKIGFGAATIASAGTLGILVPPSGLLLLYAILTEQFSIALFVAAIGPAILTVFVYIVVIGIIVIVKPDIAPAGLRASARECLEALWGARVMVLLALMVGGGIYGGIFTVIEGASVGCLLSFAVLVMRRRLNWDRMQKILSEAASTTAMIYLIIVGAALVSTFTTLTRVPDTITMAIIATGLPPLGIIFALVAMYIVLGAIFDEVAAMVITMPVVFPLVVGMGYDPIWWGVINIMLIQIGQLAPPIGMLVFILSGMREDLNARLIFTNYAPFFIGDLLRLSLVILFPTLALWLPTAFGMIR